MSAEEAVSQTLLQIQRTASVQQVYGEPITIGGETVIPIAEVRYSFGFGFGSGPNRAAGLNRAGAKRSAEGSESQTAAAGDRAAVEAGGGGGGGRATARPVGYLRVREGEVRFEPVIDASRLAMMAMAVLGWFLFLVGRARKHGTG